MIIVDLNDLETIKAFAKKAYPNECCGLLAGRDTDGKKEVTEVHALTNLNTERSNDRYEVDPAEYMKIDRETSKRGLNIVGIYHSHPDHPSRPSEFDAGRAWEGYSYLIVAVANGQEFEIKSWVFSDSTKTFSEEEIRHGK